MAATRLRRTFQYPSESDDEDAVEQGMDEQDQNDLITTLSTHDTSATRIYTLTLLLFPLAPTLLYLPRLLSLSTLPATIATITSLLATAYTLYFLPLPPIKPMILETSDPNNTRNKGKAINRGSYGYNVPPTHEQAGPTGRKHVPYISDGVADLLARYIIPGNAVVCGILAVHELWQGRAWREGMMVGGGYLPGLILTTILWARRELRVVDLGELERLRYRSKGL